MPESPLDAPLLERSISSGPSKRWIRMALIALLVDRAPPAMSELGVRLTREHAEDRVATMRREVEADPPETGRRPRCAGGGPHAATAPARGHRFPQRLEGADPSNSARWCNRWRANWPRAWRRSAGIDPVDSWTSGARCGRPCRPQELRWSRFSSAHARRSRNWSYSPTYRVRSPPSPRSRSRWPSPCAASSPRFAASSSSTASTTSPI